MPTQLQNLSDETRDELASLALRMSGNKKTRNGFLGLVKEVAPDTPIPELDTRAVIDEALKEEREERAKLRQELTDERLKNDLAARKSAVREQYGLGDEDMKKMEEMMGKKELPTDYDFAARLYRQQTEATTPTSYGTSGYGPLNIVDGGNAMGNLMQDEKGWSLATAHSIVDEMLSKRSKPSF